jgi:hypothetical protein
VSSDKNISAPGGSYSLPPPINGTNTDASQQNRGGTSDSSNPNGPLGPQGPTPNITQSAPTQPGIVSYCDAFTTAPANGTCYDFTLEYHISLEELTTWNPVLGYPDGHNCTTQFWTGYDYCKFSFLYTRMWLLIMVCMKVLASRTERQQLPPVRRHPDRLLQVARHHCLT